VIVLVIVSISGVGVLLIIGIAANLGILSVKQLHGCESDFGVHEHDEPAVFDESVVLLFSI
jgi:hypothetical protein